MCAILITKELRLTRVNEGSHSSTCHPHVYPQMERVILKIRPVLYAQTPVIDHLLTVTSCN